MAVGTDKFRICYKIGVSHNFIYIFYVVGNERKTLYYCIFLYNLKNCQKGPSPVAKSGQKGPSPMAIFLNFKFFYYFYFIKQIINNSFS